MGNAIASPYIMLLARPKQTNIYIHTHHHNYMATCEHPHTYVVVRCFPVNSTLVMLFVFISVYTPKLVFLSFCSFVLVVLVVLVDMCPQREIRERLERD
jgi:ABC-type nickel/cobalt efflux system permease component RcnA